MHDPCCARPCVIHSMWCALSIKIRQVWIPDQCKQVLCSLEKEHQAELAKARQAGWDACKAAMEEHRQQIPLFMCFCFAFAFCNIRESSRKFIDVAYYGIRTCDGLGKLNLG